MFGYCGLCCLGCGRNRARPFSFKKSALISSIRVICVLMAAGFKAGQCKPYPYRAFILTPTSR